MRLVASMFSIAVLAVLTTGCTERNNGNAIPAKGLDPALVAKTSEPSTSETVDASPGRKVYDAHGCGRCHRLGAPNAPSKGPNLSTIGAKHPADWIAAHVRNPKTHKAGSRMPAYPESKISDDDLKTLAEYLASLK
jgi:mono/diheme cytochrome c family protein